MIIRIFIQTAKLVDDLKSNLKSNKGRLDSSHQSTPSDTPFDSQWDKKTSTTPPFYRNSPESSRTIKLIVRGILYAASDIDPVIRRPAHVFIFGMADVFAGLLTLRDTSFNNLKLGSQIPPLDPMEFIAALSNCIDLRQWAVSSLAIQVGSIS